MANELNSPYTSARHSVKRKAVHVNELPLKKRGLCGAYFSSPSSSRTFHEYEGLDCSRVNAPLLLRPQQSTRYCSATLLPQTLASSEQIHFSSLAQSMSSSVGYWPNQLLKSPPLRNGLNRNSVQNLAYLYSLVNEARVQSALAQNYANLNSPHSVCGRQFSSPTPDSIADYCSTKKLPRIQQDCSLTNGSQHIISDDENAEQEHFPQVSSENIQMPLALPRDKDKLSSIQCFLRDQIEIFTASEEDVTTHSRGRNKPIQVGQVGIRCKHCCTLPLSERSKGSGYFPSALVGIYQAAQNMQHYHFSVGCPMMSSETKSLFDKMLTSRSCFGGGKCYWAEAAQHLGLVESSNGIWFKNHMLSCKRAPEDKVPSSEPCAVSALQMAEMDQEGILLPEDRSIVTDYMFLLMSQMQPCCTPLNDRVGKSIPGLMCKHCKGVNGCGMFFRTKVSSLAKNENMAQIYKHMDECRRCPKDIKNALKNLKEIHPVQKKKLRRGSKTIFFSRVMARICLKENVSVPDLTSEDEKSKKSSASNGESCCDVSS